MVELLYSNHYSWQEPDGSVTFESSSCFKTIMFNEDKIPEEVDIVFQVEKRIIGRGIKNK